MAKELPITEFDLRTVDESTQMFKAMIPFLDYQLQKPLSLIIRMNEFSQTLRFYNRSPGNPAIRGQSSHAYINSINDIFTNDDFLNTVMPYCPEKYAAMIEQFRSFSKVSEIMNLFQSFDDGADLFNNPIILNMMNQTVNTTNNTANPKNSKDGNTPGKTDVKAPPPKKTPADGAQNEPNVSADTTGMPKSQHTSGTKSSAPPTGLLNMLLTPEQQKQYDTYMKTLSDFNL